MNITIPDYYKASQIITAVKEAEPGAVLSCTNERQFALLKIALVKLQRSELTLQLLDQQGYALRQVTTRKKQAEPQPSASDEMAASQVKAVRELEKALVLCRREGLAVIGFSDSLVAVPEHLGAGLEVLSSTSAMEVDTGDCYRGFEDDME
ncbi:response regulator [Motiliproteus sp. SC1-56]|uniref:response regulator n=1 Tax=Motiliproteus sp. SC1-56 TaxID=2799565 RepID=UPI001A8E1B18|nr:response regulator [Motiliproteus sp. SC1-56]